MSRPLGPEISNWTPPPLPKDLSLSGQWARLDLLDVQTDAVGLWEVFAGHDWVWDYLFEHPPEDFDAFRQILETVAALDDKPCYVIRAKDDPAPLGYACYWTAAPAMGCHEIGSVNLSPRLQKTQVATEAFFLMLDWAFAHGYRRMEWKCNALNMPSRRAAERLGFQYEGVFRQHMIVKGLNRDTAWYAITDKDWVKLREAYQTWLAPENFDQDGQQKQSLKALTAVCRAEE